MNKKIEEVKKYVTDEKNRTTVIAAATGLFAVVAGIVTIIAKRGKKRK